MCAGRAGHVRGHNFFQTSHTSDEPWLRQQQQHTFRMPSCFERLHDFPLLLSPLCFLQRNGSSRCFTTRWKRWCPRRRPTHLQNLSLGSKCGKAELPHSSRLPSSVASHLPSRKKKKNNREKKANSGNHGQIESLPREKHTTRFNYKEGRGKAWSNYPVKSLSPATTPSHQSQQQTAPPKQRQQHEQRQCHDRSEHQLR